MPGVAPPIIGPAPPVVAGNSWPVAPPPIVPPQPSPPMANAWPNAAQVHAAPGWSVVPPPVIASAAAAAPPSYSAAGWPVSSVASPPIAAPVGPLAIPPGMAPGIAHPMSPALPPVGSPGVARYAKPARPSAAMAPPAIAAPPVVAATAPQAVPCPSDDARVSSSGGAGNWDWLLAAFVSAAFHMCACIVLALYVTIGFPAFQQQMELFVSAPPEEAGGPLVQEFGAPVLTSNLDPMNVYSSFVGEAAIPLPAGEDRLVIDEKPAPREDLRAPPRDLDREARRIDKGVPLGGSKDSRPRMTEVATAQQALDGVLGEIGARAEKQDLLVVWLFDASLSLRDDRLQIAERLADFYRKQQSRPNDEKHLLMSAAVAFGSGVVELEAPTRYGQKIVDAVGRVATDTTGMERTFVAVKWIAERYTRRKGQLMIVVWTDESGDDQQELEPAIQACIKHRAMVSIVGPTSVLGRIYGRQSWPNPSGESPWSLQVVRGPDGPAPERLLLPYWFDGQFPSWGDRSESSGERFPAWYGGPQMEFMLCGLGPYGLLRLVMATGGTYTLLDRPADRCPFRLELMKAYLPSYQSVKEYYDENRRRPLRQAVLSAAEVTVSERNWPPPRLEFDGPQTSALLEAIPLAQNQARRALVVINRALSHLGRDGMEKQYEQEKSARWLAWYDLTRGRLLAGLVRYTEYDLLCAAFQRGGLRAGTNRLRLVPSATLRGGAAIETAAAEAQRLLKRCMERNAYTPWAYLAQGELDFPLGLDFRQVAVPERPRTLPKPDGNPGSSRPMSKPSPAIPPRL